MNIKLYEELCQLLGRECVHQEESMSMHTTFRTGGPADILVLPKSGEIAEVIKLCKQYQEPYQVIGNGSNLLVSDDGIRGVVIEIGKPMAEISAEGESVRAGAGAMMSAIAARAAEASLTGFEFASGIPGTIGGAVVMNAGAYGGEIRDVLVSVQVLDREGKIRELAAADLDLSYRHSNVPQEGYIVLEAILHLQKGDAAAIKERMEELKELRVAKQPIEFPSAGSTFKRPEGYFAGKLIQDAGLKGYSVGGAQVSEKHSGFVINRGKATSADVRQLICDVQEKVYQQFGVHLETEVKLLGKF